MNRDAVDPAPLGILRELRPWLAGEKLPLFAPLEEAASFEMPARHSIELKHLQPASLRKVLLHTYETQADGFEPCVHFG